MVNLHIGGKSERIKNPFLFIKKGIQPRFLLFSDDHYPVSSSFNTFVDRYVFSLEEWFGFWGANPNQHAMEINGGFAEGIDRLKGSMQADRRQSTLP